METQETVIDEGVSKSDTEEVKITEDPDDEQSNEIGLQSLLYRVGESPPWLTSIAFSIQQILLYIGGFLTFPMIIMNVMCADDSQAITDSRAYVIGAQIFVSGVATFIQSTFGVRLSIMQGLTAAYFTSALAILSGEEWTCPARMDLTLNKTMHFNWTLTYRENSTPIIEDFTNNVTIVTDSRVNYYRDNDGLIRDSKEVWLVRLREIQGAVICAGLFQIVVGLSGVMGFLMRFIGPLTIAPTLVMIGYSLAGTAQGLASAQWGVAVLMCAIFFVCSICLAGVNVPIPICDCRKRKCVVKRLPLLSMFPVLISILAGWLICYVVTISGGFSDDPNEPSFNARTDQRTGAFERSPWFSFPYPCQWGLPTFHASSIVGMLAAVLPGILESIGDYNAAAVMSQEPPPPKHAVNRGIMTEGFGIMTAGLLGTGNATTSYTDGTVMIGITRVASRVVFQITGAILILLGVFTKFSSMFVSLPGVILGGVMTCTVGMIISVGVASLKNVDMKSSRNLFVFGVSIFWGIIVPMYAEQNSQRITVGVKWLDSLFLVLLKTPMFISGTIGFVLDNIAPGSPEMRGLKTFAPKTDSPRTLTTYRLPFKTEFFWTKWIPICPMFGSSRK